MAASTVLTIFWLWGYLDRQIATRDTAKYKPVPVPTGLAKFASSDVSIVTCALNPEPSFLQCLEGWLRNDPLEVVVVTKPPFVATFLSLLASAAFDTKKVRVFAVPADLPGYRGQLVHGIRQAKGELILKADGHIEWPSDKLIVHMAACFEDDTIGIAGGDQHIRIEDPNNISPWEVASTRQFSGGRPAARAIYAASKFRFGIGGATVLYRASLFQNAAFEEAFLNDVWHRPFGGCTRLDSGDDCFVSRWTNRHGYVCASQTLPETTERSTVQSYLRATWETPRIWHSPVLARKVLERLFRDILFIIHLWAWIMALWQSPLSTLALIWYYIARTILSLDAFFRAHPDLPRQYWWAALFADYAPFLVAPWVWWTLGKEEWHVGDASCRKP
ncbi:nucleotide-diphospho-sugar transferase [Cercophora newfieldiana]|uniref:Nucleotide-diphospho-sugar transferase n=1 Tax=Cercophora newfieldiana TaxID=92897 RepID=A0AA40CSQ0_9PEZI|nr:nucleotide-diphospho-sugar transferase [Cercophora newfieldiana]